MHRTDHSQATARCQCRVPKQEYLLWTLLWYAKWRHAAAAPSAPSAAAGGSLYSYAPAAWRRDHLRHLHHHHQWYDWPTVYCLFCDRQEGRKDGVYVLYMVECLYVLFWEEWCLYVLYCEILRAWCAVRIVSVFSLLLCLPHLFLIVPYCAHAPFLSFLLFSVYSPGYHNWLRVGQAGICDRRDPAAQWRQSGRLAQVTLLSSLASPLYYMLETTLLLPLLLLLHLLLHLCLL